ncbi:MAG: amidohydrolase family protein [Armatimonadota bacterium]
MGTILRTARVFDGGVRGVRRDATVVIDGERIESIGTGNARPARDGDTVVDLSGKTLIPGLFNCHAHLGWDGYGDLEALSVAAAREPVQAGIRVARNLRACLEAGVTTIRDLGVHHTALAAKAMLRAGRVAGPRVYAAGAAICCTGGHTWWCAREADGPDEVRRAAREQIKAGADWIKVMAGGRVARAYTDAELQAAAEEAHTHGLKVTADATFSAGAKACALAGYDGIEHGGDYSPEVEQLIVERGIWVTPTFSPLTMQARQGLDWGMRPEDVERRRTTLANPVRLLGVARLRKAGANLAFGTDAGSPVVPHDNVVSEMEALIEFGVFQTVEEVLTVATRRSAEMMGLADRLGTIEAGKLADLVVVNGNPFEDLQDLRRVDKVFLGGRLMVDQGAVVSGL